MMVVVKFKVQHEQLSFCSQELLDGKQSRLDVMARCYDRDVRDIFNNTGQFYNSMAQ